MATVSTETGFPATFLNAYILGQLQEFDLIGAQEALMPGFSPVVPAQYPTNIEDLYNDNVIIRQTDSPILLVYDRLIRMRPTPFYRYKKEQLVYFVYSSSTDKLLDTIRIMATALDREDAAAEDVNLWLTQEYKKIADDPGYNSPLRGIDRNVKFNNIRVFQVDETRDIVDLASARTLFVNKLIIEFDYHTSQPTKYT